MEVSSRNIWTRQCIEWTFAMNNNFKQTLINEYSLFGHFVQKLNLIWYLGEEVTVCPGYQILLASFSKCPHYKYLKVTAFYE